MTMFLRVSLYVFVGFVALGLIPPFLLAGKARNPTLAVMALLIAGYVIYVLAAAAGELPGHG
jgi:hypothetical protein